MPPEGSEILFIRRFDMTKGIEGQRLNLNSKPLKKKPRFSVAEMSTQGKKRGGSDSEREYNGNVQSLCIRPHYEAVIVAHP